MSEIVEETGTDVVLSAAGLSNELTNLSKGSLGMYSSVKATDFVSRVKVLNAMTNSVSLGENLNKEIDLVDIIIQSVTMTNEQTGEIQDQPRVTLIAKDGTAFHAISPVIYKDVKNLIVILGEPHKWPAPVKVIAESSKARVGKFFTLKVVLPTK